MLPRIFFLAMTLFLLSACSYTPVKDTSSPDYLPPVGSQFILKQTIQLVPEQHVIYLQAGKAMTSTQFDRYEPNCQLWVRHRGNFHDTLQPGHFTMTDVYNAWTRYGMRAPIREPIMVAGYDAGNQKPFAFYSDEIIDRYVTMELSSPDQPWIWRLDCSAGWDEVWRADDPTIDQMYHALGGIAAIELAE